MYRAHVFVYLLFQMFLDHNSICKPTGSSLFINNFWSSAFAYLEPEGCNSSSPQTALDALDHLANPYFLHLPFGRLKTKKNA